MKQGHLLFLFILILLGLSFNASSQKLIKGIVVDSVSLDGLPGVHVRVKNSNHATISDTNGIFTVMVKETDTVTFSYIGYTSASLRVNVQDELMFVRLHDNSIMLNEIVIRPSFFDQEYTAQPRISSPALMSTKPLPAAGVNFAYFTKAEKEKRKLVKVLDELDHARVYIDIVNDPGLKKEIMDHYIVTEEKYYELLAYFNEHNSAIIHSGNPETILNALNNYFKTALQKKK